MLYPQPELDILKKDQEKDTETNGETKNPKFEISPFKVTSSIQGDFNDPIMLLNKTPKHKGLKRRPAAFQQNLPPEVRDDPMRNNLSPIKLPQREPPLPQPAKQDTPEKSPPKESKDAHSIPVDEPKRSPPPLTDLISIDDDISSRDTDFEYEEYPTMDKTAKEFNNETPVRATKLTSFDGIVRPKKTPEVTAKTQSLSAESPPQNDFILHTPLRARVRTFQSMSNYEGVDESSENQQRPKRSRTSSNTLNSGLNTVKANRGSDSTQKEYLNGQFSEYDVSDTISKARSFIHSKKLEKTRLGRPSRRVIPNNTFLSEKATDDTYVSMNSRMLEFDSSSNNQNGEGELLSGLDDERALNKQNLESLDESTRAKQLDTWGLEKWRKLAGVLKLYGVTKNEELLDPKFIQSELGCEPNELVARSIILVKWKELKSLRKMQRSSNKERSK